jgi:hypothetical protein
MSRGRHGDPVGSWTTALRRAGVRPLLALAASSGTLFFVGSPASAAGGAVAAPHTSGPSVGIGAVRTTIATREGDEAAFVRLARHGWTDGAHRAAPRQAGPDCTFDDNPDVVENVNPGAPISIRCTGWPANDAIAAAEFSPLIFQTGSTDEIDPNFQYFKSDAQGAAATTITVPNPFSAPDPAAACPPTTAQIAQGFLACGIALADPSGEGALAVLIYVGQSLPGPPPGAAAVGIAPAPDGGGYWIAWDNGTVTFHGDAGAFGDASGLMLTRPITHIVSTPDGRGYWLVAADGGTFAFGDAGFYGSMGGRPLDKPVVDLAPTPDGKGYWLVASDGGVFAFGDAGFFGSMGGRALNRQVVGIAADPLGSGYWMVASDGGVFAFGQAAFYGSTGSLLLNRPVIGISAMPDSRGYLFVASDGGVFTFGDAGFFGSTGSLTLNSPISGIAVDPAAGGYWLVGGDGGVFSFGQAAFYGAG